MTQHATKQAAEPMTTESKPPGAPMAMCPMAKICMGTMRKQSSGLLIMLPGALLIVLGVVIVIEPKVLVWLIAGASVLVGIMLLMMVSFIRKIGARLRT